MILDYISQSVLEEAIGNSEDSMPNKIKEKEESLRNTKNKRYTIPMISLDSDKKQNTDNEDVYSDASYSAATVEYDKVPTSRVEMHAALDDYETEKYTIVSTDVRTLLEGNEKPINVKEHMIINMMKKDINDFSDLSTVADAVYEEVKPAEVEETYDEHIVSEQNKEDEVIFETPEEAIEEAVSEVGKYGMPANIEKALSNTFDFDTTMVAINQTRKEFKSVAEKAVMATQAANESEELLEKISSEYSEAEKQLKEKERRSLEMEQKIIEILNSEKDRISQQMQEKESLINDANRRKEQNNDKIVDFRSKINSTMEKANEIDEKISKQEELLNTLVNFNINLENYSMDTEEKTPQRIA